MAMRREREFEGYLMDGMARAIWVHAYMLWATNVQPSPELHGETWDEVAPDNASTRRASMMAARELAELIIKANRVPGLAALFQRAVILKRGQPPGNPRDVAPGAGIALQDRGTEADLAREYGSDLAHLCMGSLDMQDSLLPLPDFVAPFFKVTLDDDGEEISWDGGLSWPTRERPNPCRGNPDDLEILVIEDDKQLQKLYPRMIRKLFPGAEVIVVDNYDAAVGYLRTHPIKRVFSDVDIIGPRSGIEVFQWVQENQPHLVDNYVFVTGGNPHVERLHYRYVEKPFTQDDLKEAIRRSAPSVARTTSARRAPAPAVRALDLAGFSALVNEAASRVRPEHSPRGGERGRYGADQAFISAIWRILSQDPRFRGMSLEQFKRQLIDANREQLIALVRADLIDDMDPWEVEESEIEDMGATFHFVLDPSARSRPARAPAPPPATRSVAPHQHPRPGAVMDIQTFGALVNQTAGRIRAEPSPRRGEIGRYGFEKVFISAIWRDLSQDPRFRGMTLPQFKRRLLEANRAGQVQLSRADLVGAMDPLEVSESEIEDMGATVHFVNDPNARAPWDR
jgi:CheY-like chemotaxis protein